MKKMKYTIKDFQRDFPDDDRCLEWLKDYLYPDGIFCPNDKKITPHHKLKNRKAYSCELCGHHTYPAANTIFHKSRTPLTLWFYAIFLMASTRAGISAKQIERETGTTYKCAFRMFHQIRSMMGDDGDMLSGSVEIDEAYLTPDSTKNTRLKKSNGRFKDRGKVIWGAVERGGRVRAKHIQGTGISTLKPLVLENVDLQAKLYSDQLGAYKLLYKQGYDHKSVNHQREFVSSTDRKVHTQNIENFWSILKGGIRGVYRHIDAKYLQAYANEYSFRYSHRNDFQPMFWALMGKVTK